MNDKQAFLFEIVVHAMEFFVIIGIASSVYFVRKSRRKNENKNIK